MAKEDIGPKETLIIEPVYSKEVYMNNGEMVGWVKNLFMDLGEGIVEGVCTTDGRNYRFFKRDDILNILRNKLIVKTCFFEMERY